MDRGAWSIGSQRLDMTEHACVQTRSLHLTEGAHSFWIIALREDRIKEECNNEHNNVAKPDSGLPT